MSYQVHITSTAEHDIMRAADYIEFTLRNPDAADNLLDAATEQIGSLADLPQKFRLVDDPVLASWGIRFVIINNVNIRIMFLYVVTQLVSILTPSSLHQHEVFSFQIAQCNFFLFCQPVMNGYRSTKWFF